jgi:hypothetical protein
MSSIPASGDNAFEAGMREAWRVFLQSRYRAFGIMRVSRYKVICELVNYPGIVILLTVAARSGLSSVTKLSWKQELFAKTVTSFLIILSVLEVSCAVLHPIKLDYFPTGLVHDFQIYYFCLSETNFQARSQILS